ncbi:hypothetical protein ZHAS_00000356 [Anopheles sinensis]|uniref:Uncharacterized protein n=1 Tax=Anopheles sinensis TaxID=74873 RepID=A0A084VA45_ANOSI|nr:hypothetical protein ZHAS_00000356 [Anopheles sinensis]
MSQQQKHAKGMQQIPVEGPLSCKRKDTLDLSGAPPQKLVQKQLENGAGSSKGKQLQKVQELRELVWIPHLI